jgi:hypothetical protein
MANEETSGSGKKALSQDALVENLIPNPGQQQPTVQLTGWLGKSGQEGTWNLYLSPALDEYVQFSENDVVHSQPLTAETAPLGGTSVWLKTDAQLKHVQVTTQQMQAGFLSGSITSGNLSSAAASLPASQPGAIVPLSSRGFCTSIGALKNLCPHPSQVRGALCGPNLTAGVNCISGTGEICGTGIIGCLASNFCIGVG